MLELQDSMNSKVSADWRAQGFEWYRAIWVECAELLDHHEVAFCVYDSVDSLAAEEILVDTLAD